ncbi:hypothetical protein [Hamadaea tsunoensis]|uniref:hypothetical protein n=1 Tax=Hamadaea tsunoensis TaxID=53368 RepID=UPI00040D2403|nr:hypothetical protein [Hamadaea tsunoensis]
MRWVWLVVGLLLVLTGLVWIFQGVGTLGGSSMTGDPKWTIIGAVVAVIGLVVAWRSARRRP